MYALRLLTLATAITTAASAAPLTFYFAQGGTATSGAAKTQRDNFSAALGGGLLTVGEDFESIGPVYNTPNVSGQASYVTSIGTFTATGAGQGGLNLQVRDSSTNIQGRYNVEPAIGANNPSGRWLDSNDLTEFVLNLNAPTTALGFWITDMGDVSGNFSIWIDGVQQPLSLSTRDNGNLGFFGVISDDSFSQVKFAVSVRNDGWGFDGFNAYRNPPNEEVPEPATYAMMGAGLAALALLRRRS